MNRNIVHGLGEMLASADRDLLTGEGLSNLWADFVDRARDMSAVASDVMRRLEELRRVTEEAQLQSALDAWENEGGPGPAEYHFTLVQPETTVDMIAAPGRRYRVRVNIDPSALSLLLLAARGEDISAQARELLGYLELA